MRQQLLLLSSNLLSLLRAFDMPSMLPSSLLSKVYIDSLLLQGAFRVHLIHREWHAVHPSILSHFVLGHPAFIPVPHLACP